VAKGRSRFKKFMRARKKMPRPICPPEKIFTISSCPFPYRHKQHLCVAAFSAPTGDRIRVPEMAVSAPPMTDVANSDTFFGSRKSGARR
jgi:hypothetical protein